MIIGSKSVKPMKPRDGIGGTLLQLLQVLLLKSG